MISKEDLCDTEKRVVLKTNHCTRPYTTGFVFRQISVDPDCLRPLKKLYTTMGILMQCFFFFN